MEKVLDQMAKLGLVIKSFTPADHVKYLLTERGEADSQNVVELRSILELVGKIREMGKKGLIKFNIVQIVGHVICWGGVAPVLDILIYNEPLDKLFAQGLVAGVSNAVTTAIVGSLLCIAYAATKTKAGSLTKE